MADQAENLRRLARARLASRKAAEAPPETTDPAMDRRQKKHDGPIIRVFSITRLKTAAQAIR